MKRIFLMTLLAMALPLAAFAGSVDFGNDNGTLKGSSAGMSLSGSDLVSVNGLNGPGVIACGTTCGYLGSVSFTTGSMIGGGSLQMGAKFNDGGSFVIMGDGKDGVPDGAIFTGSFESKNNKPVVWSMSTEANGTHDYTLRGTIKGTWYNGTTVNGATVELSVNTGKGYFDGSTKLFSGDTGITTVPEPGTLGLLGTGMLGLAGVLRRKFRA